MWSIVVRSLWSIVVRSCVIDHGTIYGIDCSTIMCDRSWYDHVIDLGTIMWSIVVRLCVIDRGTIYVIDRGTIYVIDRDMIM
jgi:hypothetical protein